MLSLVTVLTSELDASLEKCPNGSGPFLRINRLEVMRTTLSKFRSLEKPHCNISNTHYDCGGYPFENNIRSVQRECQAQSLEGHSIAVVLCNQWSQRNLPLSLSTSLLGTGRCELWNTLWYVNFLKSLPVSIGCFKIWWRKYDSTPSAEHLFYIKEEASMIWIPDEMIQLNISSQSTQTAFLS